MKTHTVSESDIERRWWVVDAEDRVLGRLASEIARILRGKHKPTFSRHLDVGDYVVVVNAEKVRLTGNKEETKRYFRHSGHMGGEKLVPFKRMQARKPEWVVERAVKGMMPKNKLGRQMAKKLKVYAGPDHPHEAQEPEPLEL